MLVSSSSSFQVQIPILDVFTDFLILAAASLHDFQHFWDFEAINKMLQVEDRDPELPSRTEQVPSMRNESQATSTSFENASSPNQIDSNLEISQSGSASDDNMSQSQVEVESESHATNVSEPVFTVTTQSATQRCSTRLQETRIEGLLSQTQTRSGLRVNANLSCRVCRRKKIRCTHRK